MACRLHKLRCPYSLKALLKEASGPPKKTVIDYSSPNIAKQFHIGNLRSTLIGQCLRNVSASLGDHVVGVNYLGDWGIQFAMIAAYWPQVQPSTAFWDSCSDNEKIKMLTGCYVVANNQVKNDENFRETVNKVHQQMEKSISSGCEDDVYINLWKDISKLSVKHLTDFYQILNIQFDSWMRESTNVAYANAVVDELIKKNIAYEKEPGLWVVDVHYTDKPGEYAIVRKSDSTTLYLSREIASILKRDEIFNADQYVYVVDRTQRKHFAALKNILFRIGKDDLADKIDHVSYGRVKGLSTRQGRTEFVGEIIENGTQLALDFMTKSKTIKVDEEHRPEVAKQLAISTIIFNDLKRAKNSEYEFSFKNAFDLNQTNALLLQMKHSRLFSIEQKNAALMEDVKTCDKVPEGSEDVQKLIDMLLFFDKVVAATELKQEPTQLSVYLVQLANCIGSVSSQLRIIDQPKDVAVPRLFLLSTARSVLAEGMRLLGMSPVERM